MNKKEEKVIDKILEEDIELLERRGNEEKVDSDDSVLGEYSDDIIDKLIAEDPKHYKKTR